MTKIVLTKNELKKQKDRLKILTRYLPTLRLKKRQFQVEISNVEEKMHVLNRKKATIEEDFQRWISVFGEDIGLAKNILAIEEVKKAEGSIAGLSIPVFLGATFAPVTYDLWRTPLWVDKAIKEMKRVILIDIELRFLEEQRSLLSVEMRKMTQRVNLFEKIKIPESRSHIKRIGIYLGDQQTAAVVRGKIAKRAMERSAS